MEQQHQELEQRNSEALERLKSDHQEELKLIAQEHKQNLENQKISDEKSHLNIQRVRKSRSCVAHNFILVSFSHPFENRHFKCADHYRKCMNSSRPRKRR